MNDEGVVSVTGQSLICSIQFHTHSFIFLDFLPRTHRDSGHSNPKPLLHWLIRRIECVRGSLPITVQCAPAFNYARSAHVTTFVDDESLPDGVQKKALFKSDKLTLDLRYLSECSQSTPEDSHAPHVVLKLLDLSAKGHKGPGVQCSFDLAEGQSVTFVLRTPPGDLPAPNPVHDKNKGNVSRENSPHSGHHKRRPDDPYLTKELLTSLLQVGFIFLSHLSFLF